MHARWLALAVAALVLVGCGSSRQEEADLAAVQRHGVPDEIYQKMVRGQDLSIGDIIALSQAHVGDDVIVRYIREQHTIYRLTHRDIARLQRGGVSQPVIDFMILTDYRSPDTPWGP